MDFQECHRKSEPESCLLVHGSSPTPYIAFLSIAGRIFMQNGAYALAALAATAGIILLTVAEQGAGLYTSLGSVLLLAALVVAALGKVVDWLRHVRAGASEPKDRS